MSETVAAPAAETTPAAPAAPATEAPPPTTVLSPPPTAPAVEAAVTEPGKLDPPKSDTPAEPPKPIAYAEFKLPEGFSPDPDLLGAFTETAAKNQISQEHAQSLIDAIVPKLAERLSAPQKAWHELNEQWSKEVKADPVVGGPNLPKTLVSAGRLFDETVGPHGSAARKAFDEFLNHTGSGNHPAFVRFVVNNAKNIEEGSPVAASRAAAAARQNPALILYPTSVKN